MDNRDKELRNKNPFAPWNNPLKDSPFAPWNNPMKRHDPFACWNNPFGRGNYEKECYGEKETNNG